MKHSLLYAFGGLLVGLALDLPVSYATGVCALGGIAWCAGISMVMLWTIPIIAICIGLLKGTKRAEIAATTPEADLAERKRIKKILYICAIPFVAAITLYLSVTLAVFLASIG